MITEVIILSLTTINLVIVTVFNAIEILLEHRKIKRKQNKK
jgi:hypothetical protein